MSMNSSNYRLELVLDSKAMITLIWACIRNVYLIFQGNGLIAAELIYVVRLIESNRRYPNITTVIVDICTETNVFTIE